MAPSILFINRVFPPDAGATAQVLADLAVAMADQGWAVTVLAGGHGEPGPDVTASGVRVIRTKVPPGRGPLDTVRQWAGLARAARALPCPDVAVTMTDPPMLALLGPWLRRCGAATVHWCQDLYPSLLPVLGRRRLPASARAGLDRLAARVVAGHDRVVATGRCMAARLVAAGLSGERLVTIPNWPDSAIRAHDPGGAAIRDGLGLNDRFVALYSGNFGRGHPFEGIIGAAERLQDRRSPVVVVLAGQGRRRTELAEAIDRRRLHNVRLLPWRDRATLSAALSAADVHLATLSDDAVGMMVPSKVYGALASGRPCLFLGPRESEVARLISRSGAGAVVPPADARGLAALLSALAADPARCRELGARAAAAVVPYRLPHAAGAFSALAWAAIDARRGTMPTPDGAPVGAPGGTPSTATAGVPAIAPPAGGLARSDGA